MSKAILVTDIPEECLTCKFCSEWDHCNLEDKGIIEDLSIKPDWCPLVPMPDKKEVCGKYPQTDEITASYKVGWNDCIDAIGGNGSDRK